YRRVEHRSAVLRNDVSFQSDFPGPRVEAHLNAMTCVRKGSSCRSVEIGENVQPWRYPWRKFRGATNRHFRDLAYRQRLIQALSAHDPICDRNRILGHVKAECCYLNDLLPELLAGAGNSASAESRDTGTPRTDAVRAVPGVSMKEANGIVTDPELTRGNLGERGLQALSVRLESPEDRRRPVWVYLATYILVAGFDRGASDFNIWGLVGSLHIEDCETVLRTIALVVLLCSVAVPPIEFFMHEIQGFKIGLLVVGEAVSGRVRELSYEISLS